MPFERRRCCGAAAVIGAEEDTTMTTDVRNGSLVVATALAILLTATIAAADCTSPTVIPGAGGTVNGTTSGTSALAGTCEPGPTGDAPEAVFQWMPDVSGIATVETCSATETTYDTVVYVRAAGCTDGPELACNDDT